MLKGYIDKLKMLEIDLVTWGPSIELKPDLNNFLFGTFLAKNPIISRISGLIFIN